MSVKSSRPLVKVSPGQPGIGACPLSTLIPETIPFDVSKSMNPYPSPPTLCIVDSSNIITPETYFSSPSVVNKSSL